VSGGVHNQISITVHHFHPLFSINSYIEKSLLAPYRDDPLKFAELVSRTESENREMLMDERVRLHPLKLRK